MLQDLETDAPRHVGAILVLAHFLDRMLMERPARKSDAPAWFESAAALMRRELQQLAQGSPQVQRTCCLGDSWTMCLSPLNLFMHTSACNGLLRCCGLLQDTLTPVHQYVEAVLGPGHPVAAEMRELSAANESPAVRAARVEKQRVMEVPPQTNSRIGFCSPHGSPEVSLYTEAYHEDAASAPYSTCR